MVTPEGLEFAPKELFERGKCIDFSLRSLPYLMLQMSEAKGIKERFLGEEVSRGGRNFILIIPTVHDRIKERVAQLVTQNDSAVITDEQLGEMQKQTDQEIRRVEFAIRDRVQELGLVNTQSPRQFFEL